MPWQAKTEFTPLVLQPARTSVPPSAQIRTTAAAVVRSAPVVLTASGYAKMVRAASSAILVSRGTAMAIAAMVARLTWKKIQRTVELVVWLATSRRTAIRRAPEVALARCIVLRGSSFGITITTTLPAACRSRTWSAIAAAAAKPAPTFSTVTPLARQGLTGWVATQGFQNCDRNASNGCEVDTSNEVANCGKMWKHMRSPNEQRSMPLALGEVAGSLAMRATSFAMAMPPTDVRLTWQVSLRTAEPAMPHAPAHARTPHAQLHLLHAP